MKSMDGKARTKKKGAWWSRARYRRVQTDYPLAFASFGASLQVKYRVAAHEKRQIVRGR